MAEYVRPDVTAAAPGEPAVAVVGGVHGDEPGGVHGDEPGGVEAALGADAPLAVRGVEDIVNDLGYNTLGAVLLAAFGTGYLDRPVAYARTLLE